MKKFLSLFAFSFLLVLTSCTSDLKDDISDLQSELDELRSLSLFPAVNVTHQYSYNASNPITDELTFQYSNRNYQYIKDNGDNTYDIYIYNFDNPGWNDDVELEFTYDASTDEVTYLGYDIDYVNDYGDRIRLREYYFDSLYDTEEFTINSINVETGEISVVLNFTYSADSNNNIAIYDTSGVFTMEYEGTLTVRPSYPN